MSICVAALSESQRAIVCIADKALSYGGSIQWDSDSSKIISLGPEGPLILFAGEGTPTTSVLAGLFSRPSDLGKNKTKAEILSVCETEYKDAMNELIEATFLRPQLLSKQDYIAAITAAQINPFMMSVAEEIKAFQMDCQLLVCGFASNGLPYILTVESPGIVTDMTQTGFHAIGSGWEKAVARLLFSEYKRAHALHRTVYDSFDAKVFAEMAVGVGFEWDSQIITKDRVVEVKKDIKDLIEKAWTATVRSPFEKRQKDDLPPPPKNWRETLETYFRLIAENPDAASAFQAKLNPSVSLIAKGDFSTEPKLMSSQERKQIKKIMKWGEAQNRKLRREKTKPPSSSQT